MLRGFSIVRPVSFLCATALVLASFAAQAPANEIEVSLNVYYEIDTDPLSGGYWDLVAKSDGAGIAGLQLLLTGIDSGSETLAGPRGFVNGTDPAGFSFISSFNSGLGYREVDVLQRRVITLGPGEEQSIFYGVGTITNGMPSDLLPGGYDSLTGAVGLPWAPVPPGDELAGDPAWEEAALLLTGTFSDGFTPGFYSDPTHISSGSLYTSVGTESLASVPVLIEEIDTFVRTNLSAALPDYNDNGFVDAADYTVWRDAMTAGSSVLTNDTTPGTVDEDDFLVWRQYYGLAVGSGSGGGAGAGLGAAAVPEPGTLPLLLGAVAVLLLRPGIWRLRNVRFG